MDRAIRTAWNAFWVGLGASAILIGQTVLTPPAPPAPSPPSVEEPAPAPPPAKPLVAARGSRLG